MKNTVFVFFLLIICTGISADSIKVSTIDSPPYYVANPLPGEKSGIAIDLVTEAWKMADTEVLFDFIPIARAKWSLLENKHTALLGTSQWFSEEDQNTRIDSVNLLKIDFKIFYKKKRFPDGLNYEKLEDLKDYKIGNVRGSSTLPILEDADLNIELVGLVKQNFHKLHTDRIDLVVAVELTGWMFLKELYPDSFDDYAATDKNIYTANIGLVFRKENKEAIKQFKKGLIEIIENGTYETLINEYYNKGYVFENVIPESLKKEVITD